MLIWEIDCRRRKRGNYDSSIQYIRERMPFVPREIGNKFFVFHGGKSKRARGMRKIRGGIIVVLHPGKCEKFSSASARAPSAQRI